MKAIRLDSLGGQKEYVLQHSGGPTGSISQGEVTRIARSFLINGQMGDWIGFRVDVFLNRDKPDPWHHWIEKTAQLAERPPGGPPPAGAVAPAN